MNKIRKARENARMNQKDLSERSGISQGQISKYESDDFNLKSISAEHLFYVSNALGVDINYFFQETEGFNEIWSNPYSELFDKANLTDNYINANLAEIAFNKSELKSIDSLRSHITKSLKPPIVCLRGQFDSGKSFLINKLLCDEVLNSGYQPETALVTFVVHSKYKLKTDKDDVIIFNKNFSIDKFLANQISDDWIIETGNKATLSKYSIDNAPQDSEPLVAVLYSNAKILDSVILCDAPGNAESEDDINALKADTVLSEFDSLIYLSDTKGFIDSKDLTYINSLINRLKYHSGGVKVESALDNLILIASHAHQGISDAEIEKIIDRSSNRFYNYIKDFESTRKIEQQTSGITPELLANRISPFYFEIERRRKALEKKLYLFLNIKLPKLKIPASYSLIKEFIDSRINDLKKLLQYKTSILNQKEALRNFLEKLVAEEPVRKEEIESAFVNLKIKVSELEKECKESWKKVYNEVVEKDFVQSKIDDNYNNKKEASNLIISYISDLLNDKLRVILETNSEAFSQHVNEYVSNYNDHFEKINSQLDVKIAPTFDAYGSFAGGLTGLATASAFAFWASTLGNLGGYIVTAKLVSLLSAIGISVGGVGSAASFIAAIGGPITIFIAIGAIVGFVVKAIFGESWKSRLAKQVVKHLNEDGYYNRIINEYIEPYWRNTQSFLDECVDSLEKDYQAEIKKIEDDLKDYNELLLKAEIQEIDTYLKFYENIPYQSFKYLNP